MLTWEMLLASNTCRRDTVHQHWWYGADPCTGCFEDSALANSPLAFWKNDLQGVIRNKTYFKNRWRQEKADGLSSHRHSRKSISKEVPLMGGCFQYPSQRTPKTTTLKRKCSKFFVQKRLTFRGTALGWVGRGKQEEGKINPPSVLHLQLSIPHFSHLSLFWIILWNGSWRQYFNGNQEQIMHQSLQIWKDSYIKDLSLAEDLQRTVEGRQQRYLPPCHH